VKRYQARGEWRHPTFTAADPQTFRLTAGGVASIKAADGTGEDGKPKLGSFSGVAYTGAVMNPGGWHGAIICDLAGIKVSKPQRPVFRQHDEQQIVGHTGVTVTDKGVEIDGVFSGQKEHVETVTVPAGNGFQWELSIGAEPLRTEFLESGKTATVNGREVHGPLTISRETELKEISFVPLGADGNTSATVSASRGGQTVKKIYKARLTKALKAGLFKGGKYTADDIEKMSEEEAKSALQKCMDDDTDTTAADDDDKKKVDGEDDDEDDDEDEKKKPDAKAAAKKFAAEYRSAVVAENKRIGAIQGHDYARKFPEITAKAIEEEWTTDKAEAEFNKAELTRIRASRPGPLTGGPICYVAGKPEMNEPVLEAACLHAFRHSMKLEDDDFYHETAPDGKTRIRRVPHYLQAEAQKDFKTRYTDQARQYAHDLFANSSNPNYVGQFGLKPMLTAAGRGAGIQGRIDLTGETGVRDFLADWGEGLKERRRIQAEGASTISISNVLANVMNKFAFQGYLFTEQAWRKVFGIRPTNDFKPTKGINLLGDVMYKIIGPTGEIETASLGDQAFANQAQPFARSLTIPWTHIVNDDLSILSTAPQKMGQGAGLAINDTGWTLWKNMIAGTVNGDDGVSFWRTTSVVTNAAMKAGTAYKPNKLTGAGSAFGDAGLKACRAAFDNQIDPNGNPLGYEGMRPIVLHGPTLWRDVTAQAQAPTIVYGGGTAANAPNQNVWSGTYEPVMSRYVESANYGNTTTGWWMLFDPAALPVVEFAFLNGVDTPAVLQAGPDYQFERPGITIRGTIGFGANAQNFRGGVYNVGA
jgi:transcriptional antiterminator Rof (Rho-off)